MYWVIAEHRGCVIARLGPFRWRPEATSEIQRYIRAFDPPYETTFRITKDDK